MARSVVSVWGDGWGVFRLPGDLRGDLMDLRGDLMGRVSLLLAVKGDGAVHGVGGMVWEGGPSCTVFHVGTST